MADDPNNAGGQDGGNGGEGGNNEGNQGGEDKWYDKLSGDDIITPSKLQSIIKASEAKTEKTIQSAVDKATSGLPDSVKSIVENALKEQLGANASGGKGKNDSGNSDEAAQELASLKRQLDESTNKLTKLQGELDGEKTEKQAMKKRSLIMDALAKTKCTKPEAVYEIIKGRVTFDAEKGEAFVKQDNGYGAEEQRSLEDWISKEVRIDELPELFQGANRSGSSATGDQSSGGGNYKYDWNRVKDNTKVLSSDEFAAAVTAGEVANMPGAS